MSIFSPFITHFFKLDKHFNDEIDELRQATFNDSNVLGKLLNGKSNGLLQILSETNVLGKLSNCWSNTIQSNDKDVNALGKSFNELLKK